ncbi:putative membrane copper amine oxidase [Aulographum hederae CBS 113979]|uniref:Amine oxidase n=1 Tax=Aulographum hederae CBS 113979 TaxID=1176131 RepID=A0A6G1H3N9_9PEZI|nr:putative membrane copper amine oxidase [Aulographum hederae CBS 113979]
MKRATVLPVLWLFSLCLLLSLGSFVLARPSPRPKSANFRKAYHDRLVNDRMKRQASSAPCAAPGAQAISAPKKNVWYGLTDEEAAAVTKWLFSQEDLNLTAAEDAGSWDNTVLLVELMLPNKTDVLPYLDGNGPEPTRYAHVVLDHRATTEPYYADLLVGPLPIQEGQGGGGGHGDYGGHGGHNWTHGYKRQSSAVTTWEPLTYPYTRKTAGRIRNLGADDDVALYDDWLYVVCADILDITLDLWGGSCLGLENDTIDVWGIDPVWQDDGIIRWDTFWNYPTTDFDAETLLPLGLYFKSNVTGRDPSKWSLDGWLYNDIFYPTTEAFRAAYYSPDFEKLPANVEGAWADTDQQGEIPPLDTVFPPITVAPRGSRYFVDRDQKYVKWMDFEMYLSFNRDTGMQLHDIRYKGNRIIYELGLQEALAHYAGNDPVQSGTSYLDSWYGFGPYAFELVKAYDCPADATYLDSKFYTAETTHTHVDSICLFETEANYPIQRHSTSKYVAVTKNIFFTVRSVCTVGNYDYAFSYEFYMDGSIHVEVRASGYIQSAYFAKNEEYGYHIHDALSGSMHDHVLNYKVDFDILGTANTMTTVTPVAVSQVYPWSDGKARNTMKLERATIENEDQGKLYWGANGATQYKIINSDYPNKFGELPGYRVLPSEGTIYLTVQNSSNLARAANWATHDLFVTKQKDTEPRAVHPYNNQDVYNPAIDFAEFFDGDSLVQEDIVVWFNLGMHHVPHTGDLPNTVFTTAHSGFQIMPLNYLLGDPSRETVNMVRINYHAGNVSEVNEFGQGEPMCSYDFKAAEPDFWGYTGDVVIRKFPYDPNNPYFETDSVV